jgi:paraquat-inducible protein B
MCCKRSKKPKKRRVWALHIGSIFYLEYTMKTLPRPAIPLLLILLMYFGLASIAASICLNSCASSDEQAYKQFAVSMAELKAEHDSLERVQNRIEADQAKNALSFETQTIAALTPALTRRHDSLMKLHSALVDAHEELFKQHVRLLQAASKAASEFKTRKMSASDLLQGMNKILAVTKEIRADNAEMLATHDSLNAAHKLVMSDLHAFKKGR